MGGDHHHHHDVLKVPDWRQYKVENSPELMRVKAALAQKGLSDPWLRNEVWRYDTKEFGTKADRWKAAAFRGFKWGFLAFVATVTIEKGIQLIKPVEDGHGHSSHH